jgi:hypothetical protein
MRQRRAVLVVFMPPPVDPGDAPINMSIIVKRMVSLVRCPMSMVLNPAVLGVMDWNREISNFDCQGTSRITLFLSKK